ncbi:MAG: hypothetical protein SFW35_13665 [Chitinophagales bacterium]|nr:hypothetical protein [Chitinophagales bacterium]
MKKLHLLLIVLLYLLSSCSHRYYAPTSHNVPVFKEKNEARISGMASAIYGYSGEVQVAYAPIKHMGIIANAAIVNPRAIKEGSDNRGHLYELGAGYFKPFGGTHTKSLFVFETYGVLGLGGCRGYYFNSKETLFYDANDPYNLAYPNNYITTRFVKAYAQPSISIGHDVVDFILSAKIGMVHNYRISNTIPDSIMNNLSPSQNLDEGTVDDDWTLLNNQRTAFVFEPAITLRLGFKYLKFQTQLSFLVRDPSRFLQQLATPVMASMGASINIAPRFKKKGWKLTPTDAQY